MKFEIRIKKGQEELAHVEGIVSTNGTGLRVEELERIPEVEAFLERLTGLRFHIQQLC